MQLDTDYIRQNVKKEHTNNHFCTRSRSQIEIDNQEKIDTSRKLTKWGIITIPVYQNTIWWRFWRPNPVIMIKLPGLAKDLLCQIKSMSTDDIDSWFTDEFSEESSELSSEPEESKRNL